MFFEIFILSIILSIDSISAGAVYGIKGTVIPIFSKLIIFISSIVFTSLSTTVGCLIGNFFPELFLKIIATAMLSIIGINMIIQGFISNKSKSNTNAIEILKNPSKSDMDNSGSIDIREALLLSIALSIDSIGLGFVSYNFKINKLYFPFITGAFQLIFLNIGLYLGKFIKNKFNFAEKYLSLISGLVLICFSIIKLF